MLAINGHSGFIGQALLRELDKRGIKYKLFDRRLPHDKLRLAMFLNGVTKVLFLSSPSDSNDFKDREQTTESMIDNYVFNLNTIKENNPDIEIIFGSSIAVMDINYRSIDSLDTSYAVYKLAIEHYIRSKFKKFKILRIPRVYGRTRQKGLMKKLREKPIEEFEDKSIQFVDISDFIPQFVDFIEYEEGNPRRRVLHASFQKQKRMLPKEIKEYYDL